MNTAPALSLRNIHKSFGGVVAVEDLSLDVKRGEIVALVGDNGAGKSTIVKIIAGMHQASSGEIRLAGELVHFIEASQSAAHRQEPGPAAQEPGLSRPGQSSQRSHPEPGSCL
jgi:ABC-type sugar transport system ATPase subunit